MTRRVLALAAAVWLGAIRRKDIYVILVLLGGLFGVIVSADLFGLAGVATYVQDVGLLLAWIFGWLIALLASSRELPAEEQRGTALPLIAKPVSRLAIVLGKWLGTWSLAVASTTCFYLLVVLAAAAAGGRIDAAAWTQGFVLHAACLSVLTAMGVLFSTRLGGDAAAALTGVLSAGSFLIVPRIPEMLAMESGLRGALLEALYHLVPHFDVFDMRNRIVHGFGALDARTAAEILLYGASLTAFLLACAWAAYRNRTFSRKGSVL